LLAIALVAALVTGAALTGATHAQGAPDSVLRAAIVLQLVEDRFRFKGGVTPYETNIFETLVLLRPDMSIAPGLATSWEARGDTTFPGAAIMLVVLGFNFLGDSLRDVLDPRYQ